MEACFALFFVFIAGCVILAWQKMNETSGAAPRAASPTQSSSDTLTLVVDKTPTAEPLLAMALAGRVGGPRANRWVEIEVHDITEAATPRQLLFIAPALRDRLRHHSLDVGPGGELPTQLVWLAPLFMLRLPRSGQRRLRWTARVLKGPPGTAVQISAEVELTIPWPRPGYLDPAEAVNTSLCDLAELALMMGISDGHFDQRERQRLKELMEAQLPPDTDNTHLREMVNNRIESSYRRHRGANATSRAEDLARSLGKDAGRQFRCMVYTFITEMAAADGAIESAERKLLDLIRDPLGITASDAKMIEDKLLTVDMHSDAGHQALLGLDPSWSADRQRAHLRSEYRTWSSRVTHRDPAIAAEAKRRLELISEHRARLQEGSDP